MSRLVAISGLALVPYQPSAFETLYQIDQACFPKRIAYGRDVLRSYLRAPGSHSIVAEVNGKVAGFILTERTGEVAHVITLDVLSVYRRQSIGSQLLEAAEQQAASQGALQMVLETATTNHPAIALWKKHGYRQSVTLANYYGRGLDAFEMHKQLEQKSKVKALP